MIEVWDYEIDHDLFARVGSRAFRQCEASDRHETTYPVRGVAFTRCGGDAMRGVTWDGIEGRHNVLVCDHHSLEYLGRAIMVRQ